VNHYPEMRSASAATSLAVRIPSGRSSIRDPAAQCHRQRCG